MVINNMVCPFRKVTTFEYDYSSLGNGSHNIKKTEEDFGTCYEEGCPFYYKDSFAFAHCEKCGGGHE